MDHLDFNGKKLCSSRRTSYILGCTIDYVSKLCREGKLKGKIVGRSWYVEEGSIKDFIITRDIEKSLRHSNLSEKLIRHYKKVSFYNSIASVVKPAILFLLSGSLAVVLFLGVAHNESALSTKNRLSSLGNYFKPLITDTLDFYKSFADKTFALANFSFEGLSGLGNEIIGLAHGSGEGIAKASASVYSGAENLVLEFFDNTKKVAFGFSDAKNIWNDGIDQISNRLTFIFEENKKEDDKEKKDLPVIKNNLAYAASITEPSVPQKSVLDETIEFYYPLFNQTLSFYNSLGEKIINGVLFGGKETEKLGENFLAAVGNFGIGYGKASVETVSEASSFIKDLVVFASNLPSEVISFYENIGNTALSFVSLPFEITKNVYDTTASNLENTASASFAVVSNWWDKLIDITSEPFVVFFIDKNGTKVYETENIANNSQSEDVSNITPKEIVKITSSQSPVVIERVLSNFVGLTRDDVLQMISQALALRPLRITEGLANSVSTSFSSVNDRIDSIHSFDGNLSGDLSVSGNATLGSLNGPLQANNGLVSATSSVGVIYGGTGLTTAPTYGQLLVGNSSGGYTLTATSSLGISGGASFGQAFEINAQGILTSTTTKAFLASGNLYASSSALIGATTTASVFVATSTTATSTFAGGLSVGSSLYVLQNGNVGIGTTTPGDKLVINGTLGLTGTLPSIRTAGNRFSVNETGAVPTNETGMVTQFSSGSYGRSIFAVTHTGTNTAFFGLDSTLFSLGGEGNTDIRFVKGLSYASSNILNSGSELMRIVASTGNVGVGTSSPYARLSITGAGLSTGHALSVADSSNATKFYVTDNGNIHTASTLFVGGTSAIQWGDNDLAGSITGALTAVSDGVFRFLDSSGGGSPRIILGSNSSSWPAIKRNGAGIDFRLADDSGYASTTASNFNSASNIASWFNFASTTSFTSSGATYLASSGNNVGVGTTSPFATLSVNPTAGLASNQFVVGSSTATSFIVNNSGRVGVGTTTPWAGFGISSGATTPFEIANTSNLSLFRVDSSGNIRTQINTKWYQHNAGGAIEYPNTYFSLSGHLGTLNMVSSTGAYIVVGNNNSVGVSTSTPWASFAVNPVAGLSSNQFVVGSSTATNFIINNSGRVGIGTTTPWRTLSVGGAMAISGVPNSTGDEYLCHSVNGDVSTSTTACGVSSQRYKHNIQDLDSSDGIDLVRKLRPVSFEYNSNNRKALGFVAEEVEPLENRLSVYENDGTTVRGVDYIQIVPILTKALQEVDKNVESLASDTSTVLDNSGNKTFLGRVFDRMISWFGDVANGISDFFANRVHTETLCVGNSSFGETCITKTQLDNLLQNANVSGGVVSGGGGSSSGGSTDNSGGNNTTTEQGGGVDNGNTDGGADNTNNVDVGGIEGEITGGTEETTPPPSETLPPPEESVPTETPAI